MKFTIREKASGHSMNTPEDIFRSFKGIEAADQESFWLLGFDNKNREILRECLFLGGYSSCIIDSRIIFKRLLVKNCSSFIVVHNHPSGDPAPSNNDIEIASKIKEGAKILDLQLMDSIIIGEKDYVSFVRNKLF